MTVKGAAAIADLLRHRACPLTDMLLAHNKLSPDGCVAIAQAIKEAVSVGDETTHAVYGGRAQAAAFNLRYLDMTGVDAGASGTIALREAAEAASALLASSRDGGLFEIDGLEEIWLPAAPTPRRVPSSSRSDFSGFSLTGPASVVTMPERTDRKPAAAATPSSALAQVMKAVSPVNAMPASSTPASMHVSGSQLARASVPADEATTLLIELLHRQLEDQSQQIAELRGVVFRQPVARSRRSSTPTMDATAYGTEADTSKSRIGRLLASVAARGATESSSEHAPMSTSKRTTPDTTDWGVHSTALAASSTKRLQAVEVPNISIYLMFFHLAEFLVENGGHCHNSFCQLSCDPLINAVLFTASGAFLIVLTVRRLTKFSRIDVFLCFLGCCIGIR